MLVWSCRKGAELGANLLVTGFPVAMPRVWQFRIAT